MITFKSIIKKNEGKLIEKCLQLLNKDFYHLQYGQGTELHIDKFIYTEFINVCQDIPICQYAYFKPTDTLASLINNLRSSIIIF